MTIYTIGYGNQAPEVFLPRLPPKTVIIDVRENPYHAWHQAYTAPVLTRSLKGRYWGMPTLGNLSHRPDRWNPPSLTVARGTLYGLARKMARDNVSVCLLCMELRADGCHRRFVAQELADMMNGRAEIVHLEP
ncbi:MAG TPA: hypothetical protein VGL77_08460 [Armatimonadota bacterium]